MYCVIQKVANKKPNRFGAYKELIAEPFSHSLNGIPSDVKYIHRYGGERFHRPVLDAYKISIHKSYRECGKVKKKQWVVCTMGYYDLINSRVGDCIVTSVLKEKLQDMGITEGQLLGMVYEKLRPIIDQVTAEFENTEEFKVSQKHRKILKTYNQAKSDFEQLYGADTYDYCFDVFGELRSPEYLERLEQQQRARQEYQERSYQSSNQSNHNDSQYSSYFAPAHSNYTDDERPMLKKIYRHLAKVFHPDITQDDGVMMKLILKLKEEWGI